MDIDFNTNAIDCFVIRHEYLPNKVFQVISM